MSKQTDSERETIETSQAPALSPDACRKETELRKLLHELQVHQIELEAQNEELRRTQQELERSQARYLEMYDLAPVGYLTISEQGLILESNITAATMLGTVRTSFVKRPLSLYIFPDDQDIFYQYSKRLLNIDTPQSCELRILKMDGDAQFWVQLEAVASLDTASGERVLRIVVSNITERKRAEEQLRASEELLNSSQRLAKVGGWEWNIEHQSVFWTEETYRIHGFEVGKTIGLPQEYLEKSLNCYDEGDRHIILGAFRRCVEQGESYDLVFPFKSAFGSKLWIRTSAHAIWDRGRIVKVVGTVMDITYRKRIEDKLLEANQFSEQIIRCAQEGVIVYDLDLRIRIWNPFMEQITGMNASEILGRHPLEVFPFLRKTGMVEALKKALTGVVSSGIDFQYSVPKTGKSGWASDVSAPLRNTKGEIVGVIATVRENSWRKRMEEELCRSEEHLRVVVQTIPDLVWLKDVDGVYLNCNTMFERFFGAKEAAIVGKTDYDFVDRELAGFFRENDRKAIEAGRPTSNEEWVTFADDGHSSLLETIKTPIYDTKDRLIGVLGIGRDITWRKRMGDEMRQALDIAESSNTTMSRLLGIVAHEFRTPLGLLTGSTDILDRYWDRLTPEKRSEQNEHIRSAARQLNYLINSVISYNQLGTDKSENPLLSVDIRGICRTIAAEVEAVWGVGHACNVTIAADCGTTLLDEMLFRRILGNLLVNAFRYTPSDGTVSLHVFREENSLCMEIADTGIGIPEEDRKLIFEAFYRSRNVEGRRGLGLGLSIVNDALSQMGGSITVSSTIGEGTTMRVEIPVVDPEEILAKRK